jgi:hypothetical protein
MCQIVALAPVHGHQITFEGENHGLASVAELQFGEMLAT